MINARAETLATQPAFRDAFKSIEATCRSTDPEDGEGATREGAPPPRSTRRRGRCAAALSRRRRCLLVIFALCPALFPRAARDK